MRTSIKERMSSEEWIITIMISVALIAIVIFSFTDCITVTHHPSWSAWSSKPYKATVYMGGYLPVYVCILTVGQLLLLWLVNKKFACILGVISNFFATVIPLPYLYLKTSFETAMKDMFYDYISEYNEYVFGPIVYLIIGIGVVVTVLYFVLLHYRRKRIPKKAPVTANEVSDQKSSAQ